MQIYLYHKKWQVMYIIKRHHKVKSTFIKDFIKLLYCVVKNFLYNIGKALTSLLISDKNRSYYGKYG